MSPGKPESPPVLPNSPGHVLFILDRFIIGGYETLFFRLASYLLEKGWRVTLLVSSIAQDAGHLIPGGVEIREVGSRLRGWQLPILARCQGGNLGLATVTHIYSFGTFGFWIGAALGKAYPGAARLIAGVYLPSEYCYPEINRPSKLAAWIRCRTFDHDVPDAQKIFMSGEIRNQHESSFQRSLAAAPVVVIPLDVGSFPAKFSGRNRRKIVSIGRLAEMKSYNLNLIPVVESLLAGGLDLTWHVFGDGPLRPRMEEEILRRGLEERILLHGSVEYEKTREVMADAGLFIGMGTALLEAGLCGTPGLVAIADSPLPVTYGLPHELPFGTCGEKCLSLKERSIAEEIRRVLKMTSTEYEELCRQARLYCERYDIQRIGPDIEKILKDALPVSVPIWRRYLYLLSTAVARIVG